ncbi:MAG: hypothetical protein ACLFVN_11470 [Phycisphaeraceae bacterium]
MPRIIPATFVAALALTAALVSPAFAEEEPAERTERVYFIGNSLTDNVDYDGLEALAAARGIEQVWGRHMIPGAPLSFLWDAAKTDRGGFTEKPFGDIDHALANYAWDHVTLQPFDRQLDKGGDQADPVAIGRILAAAQPKNADAQFYIYAHWPRMRKGGEALSYDPDAYDTQAPREVIDLATIDPYTEVWRQDYTGGWDGTNETADYYDKLAARVNEANPELAHPVRIIPVGHVMDELDKKMKAGEVPGFSNIYEVYRDTIHLGPYGSYIAGVTFFATLYGEDPTGLPTEPYGELDPEVARIIQQTAWDVVRATPGTGIGKDES